MAKNEKRAFTIFSSIASVIFSIILTNLGLAVLKESAYIGIITVLIGLVLLYFAYYAFQIKTHDEKIQEFEEWKESLEELLNTLKDIVLLKKVSKIR